MEQTYSVASNPVYYEEQSLHVLFAGESQTPPLHQVGPKIYDYFLLHCIETGAGAFRTEQRTYELGPGDCFLIQPGQLVSYVSDLAQPWRYRWAAFSGTDVDRLVREAGFSPEQPVAACGDSSVIPEALAGIMKTFYAGRESGHLTSLGLLYLTLGEASEMLKDHSRLRGKDSQVKRTVKQMIHYMSSQYAHPVSIEQMCASLGYNRAYLSRIFKEETGLSPVTYLLKLRIDKSRQLLRERPELSVEQVAASVGLTDALYFSRQFKRFCGQSPTAYRVVTARQRDL
ncbi:Helix-turn-helix domain-containing protein [Paenibacillus sophorae]|uniref:AraC family transcriptional regulator n=1 Tax=Paenibacillus sophorae TaxID=1333845 RepID=A0A1H8M929_9BACL|nr:AraC family transcriptional regulator [Paenibacillus sophorae]QWU18300.1 AraC family transcriptional regulator [Paenibacillus sophorae]SEO13656.1 Helix-turn-helix domain-containing protein [Paenibacillus sophorae]